MIQKGLLHCAEVWRVKWSWDDGEDDGQRTDYIAAQSAEQACAFVRANYDNLRPAVDSVDRLLTLGITAEVIDRLVDATSLWRN